MIQGQFLHPYFHIEEVVHHTLVEIYADEHWLGSHPEFVPCRIVISSSVDGTTLYSFKTAPISTESIYEQSYDLFFYRVNDTTEEGRLHEHAFLMGHIL